MELQLSINSDFSGTRDPRLIFQEISGAGFKRVHWCHGWRSDLSYSESKIDEIVVLLKKFGLQAQGVHASEGVKYNWLSEDESRRVRGVELVKNRIYMAHKFSAEEIVLHFKRERDRKNGKNEYWGIFHRSLDELKPYAKKYGIRIALENLCDELGKEMEKLFSEYPSDFLGLCYDSGHENMGGPKVLEKLKDRLIFVHLHDNDGVEDKHQLPYSGTVDWGGLARTLVSSPCDKRVCLEVSMEFHSMPDKESFLLEAFAVGRKFSEQVQSLQF